MWLRASFFPGSQRFKDVRIEARDSDGILGDALQFNDSIEVFFFSRLFGEFQDGRSIWIATGWSESIKFSWMWSNGNCNNSTRFFRDSRGIRTDSRGIDIHPPLMSYHNGINHTNGRIWPGASVPVAILFMCYEYNTVLNTTNQSINQSINQNRLYHKRK